MLIARAGDDAAVAVVIAAPSASLSMGGAGDGVGSKQSLEENILSEMRSEAAAAGLRVWEIPARVVLDAGPWDEASGCCSAHGKLRRKAIAKRAGLLTLRVADDEARRPAMNGPKRLSSITENLSAVLAFFSVDSDADAAAALPALGPERQGAATADWASLGGDSIGAATLVQRSPVPLGLSVRAVLRVPLWTLRRRCQSNLAGRSDGQHVRRPMAEPTCGGGGNEDGEVLGVAFWERECRMEAACESEPSADTAAASSQLHRGAPDTASEGGGSGSDGGPCVLVTGGTGFLGPHLLCALVLGGHHGRRWSTVMVLARDVDAAKAAVAAALAAADAAVPGSGQTTVCTVYAADLALPGLGLAPAAVAALRSLQLRAVVHSAAVVDHVQPYLALRSPNAMGAEAVLELLKAQGIREGTPPVFIFVSSLSAVAQSEVAEALMPAESAARLRSGYGQSKLVAERRLAAAIGPLSSAGLARLVVARMGLLGPPATTAGVAKDISLGGAETSGMPVANHRDWLHRLMRAVAVTHSSPAGITGTGTDRAPAVALLPVDAAAGALAALAADEAVGDLEGSLRVLHFDAATFGVAPTTLSVLVDALEAELSLTRQNSPSGGSGGLHSPRAAGDDTLIQRDVPYSAWCGLAADAGRAAAAALVALPAATTSTGRVQQRLRLPSGARPELARAAGRAALGPQVIGGAGPSAASSAAESYSSTSFWRGWAHHVIAHHEFHHAVAVADRAE